MTPDSEQRRLDLAATALALGKHVAQLAEASVEQAKALDGLVSETEKKTWQTTIKIRWMIALVILDLVLSGAMLVGYLKVSELVNNQEIVRAQVLCPMYKVFLGSYQPETRNPGPDRDKYAAAFNDMWGQYAVLACTGALVPPRSDLVTTTAPTPPK